MRIEIKENQSNLICYFCKRSSLDQVLAVHEAPAFLGCTETSASQDLFLSFDVFVCPHCELIQTNAKPLDTTYAHLHSEALGPTWEAHHAQLAHFIDNQKLAPGGIILELGASAQPISRKLQSKTEEIWYVDPIQKVPFELHAKERYLSGFFPAVSPGKKVDLIIASHVLEHIPHTFQFFEAAQSQLSSNGILVISIPFFEHWFAKAYFNAISAEHVIYPFEYQLTYIAQTMGFNLQMQPYKEHSLFAVFTKGENSPVPNSKAYEKSRPYLKNWAASFNRSMDVGKRLNESKALFVTGASHLSQYFLLSNPGIEKKISAVLDNSSRKWGLRLYGTQAKACSFERLKDQEAPVVFLIPSPYATEMKKQILQLNPKTTIVDLN